MNWEPEPQSAPPTLGWLVLVLLLLAMLFIPVESIR
jgi:hypothetical protein